MGDEQGTSFQTLILDSLKRIEQDVRELRAENKALVRETQSALTGFGVRVNRLEIELAVFKAKAMAFGGIAGVVGGAIISAIVKSFAG